MVSCWDLTGEFNTFKDCLDYVAWFKKQTLVAEDISNKIENALEKYLQKARASSSNITNLLNALVELRNAIVKNADNYGVFTNKQFGENCDGGHIYNLSISLCRIYGALLFLYFNITETEKDRGGGHWSDSSCNDSNNQICKWLTIQPSSGSGLLSGGFNKDNLNGTIGNQIANRIRTQLDSNGDLQKCLDILLFLPPWLPEKTANACLLVKQLCEKISNTRPVEELRQEYSNDYKQIEQICKELTAPLGTITNGSGDKILSAVYKDSNNVSQYNVEEQFADCFAFLKECLPDLIESLGHMKGQCVSWTAENIKNAQTPGPFLYGFSFTDKCKPKDYAFESYSELTESISQVVQSLNDLNNILNPPSHAVAIGLGVVSSLLVGGSAAAAYFYPGLLSSTINMIVG